MYTYVIHVLPLQSIFNIGKFAFKEKTDTGRVVKYGWKIRMGTGRMHIEWGGGRGNRSHQAASPPLYFISARAHSHMPHIQTICWLAKCRQFLTIWIKHKGGGDSFSSRHQRVFFSYFSAPLFFTMRRRVPFLGAKHKMRRQPITLKRVCILIVRPCWQIRRFEVGKLLRHRKPSHWRP